MYFRQLISTALGCSIAFGNMGFVQSRNDAPTMDETMNFLIDKTEWISEIGLRELDSNSRTWTLKNPNKCELVWTTTQTNARYSKNSVVRGKPKVTSSSPTSVNVNLSDLDPTKVTGGTSTIYGGERVVGTHALFLGTTDDKKVIRWSGSDQSFATNSLTLHFSDDETARRYRNAITHAINLCGGKATQKKEPF